MSKYFSPLRYPGGKNCIYKFMSALIHENGLNGYSYAEPFAGGSGLALHLLMEGAVSEIYLNDFDHSIYSFWKVILDNTSDFCDWISSVEVSMHTWNWAKEVYSNMLNYDMFEIAKATFFLNRTNVSGIILGGPIGGPTQNGKYKIDARFNKTDLIRRIYKIADYKKKIHLSELDGVEFIKLMNRKHKQIFIYIDPPYVKKGADLYLNFFTEEHHRTLCNQIKKLRKPWLVSYDNHDLIHILYNDFIRISYTLSQCTSNRMGDEVVIHPKIISISNAILELKSPLYID